MSIEMVSLEDVPHDVAAETTCMNCPDRCFTGCTKSPEFREQAERFAEAEKRPGHSMLVTNEIKAQAAAVLRS